MTVAAHFAMLHIDNVVESKTNPRKHFGALDELAASVREKGVLQPVKARPVNGHFELVYGARRFRAAKAVGLKELPALIQEMSDKEVLEEQIVENSQREDVPPLEEAEGYRELIEKHGYTPDDLAAKVGKSKRVIYERLQLCKLGKEGRKALDEERLNASVALLVARIPAELQAKAVADIAARDDDDPGLSYRRAVDHIHRNYMLQLKDAPFSLTDAALVSKAGACAPCPKRTGNQRELFAEVKSADVCTDPKCYRSKEDALWQIKVKEAEKSGQKVLSAKEAKSVFPSEYSDGPSHGSAYTTLDAEEWVGDKRKSVKSLLGKDAPEPVLARAPSGKIVELVPKAEVQKKIRQPQPKTERAAAGEGRSNFDHAKFDREQRIKEARAQETVRQIVAKIEKGVSKGSWFILAEALLEDAFEWGAEEFGDFIERRLGRPPRSDHHKDHDEMHTLLSKMTTEQLVGFVFEFSFHRGEAFHAQIRGEKGPISELASALGIDTKKIAEQVKKADAEKEKQAAVAAKPAPAKAKKAAAGKAKNK